MLVVKNSSERAGRPRALELCYIAAPRSLVFLPGTPVAQSFYGSPASWTVLFVGDVSCAENGAEVNCLVEQSARDENLDFAQQAQIGSR